MHMPYINTGPITRSPGGYRPCLAAFSSVLRPTVFGFVLSSKLPRVDVSIRLQTRECVLSTVHYIITCSKRQIYDDEVEKNIIRTVTCVYKKVGRCKVYKGIYM